MLRKVGLFAGWVLCAVLLPGMLPAQEIQQGTLKSLDLEAMQIIVTVDGQDTELSLSDETQVLNAEGKDLAEKLRDFKPGVDLYFKVKELDGKQVAIGLKLAGANGKRGADPKRPRRAKGEQARRAKVKEIDAEGGKVTLTVDDKDIEYVATDETMLRGARGKSLAEKLAGFAAGTEVMFLGRDQDGKHLLIGMMRAEANADRREKGGLASPAHADLKPLDELGTDEYQGFQGGFYPDGKNQRPEAHEAAGLALGKQVQPLDADGKPDSEGSIVLLSIGMSNTSQASTGFQQQLAEYDERNPRLVFVNGAQGGMTAAAIQDPNDGERGTRYWREVDQRLEQAGVTRAQVQATWIKQADAGPRDGFPAYARTLQAELAQIVRVITERFPNARLCYLSSRTYGGYATTGLNPEPYAYESGFAVKWLIEEQLHGTGDLNFDPMRGAVRAPWLSWGPYLWANGSTPRAADGFCYQPSDFGPDGTHHADAGSRKIGGLMLDFFRADTTSKIWFNRP